VLRPDRKDTGWPSDGKMFMNCSVGKDLKRDGRGLWEGVIYTGITRESKRVRLEYNSRESYRYTNLRGEQYGKDFY
jgi:hypothetical protein